MSHDLAIIIPAYKPNFLKQTLQSILQQTDQRFALYIFDDASPHNLAEIINEFDLPENVSYYRFEENAGQKSLVKHWKRCIGSISDENWIWLFSDDDILEPDCVKEFYKAREKNRNTHCFRFNTKKIDENGELIRENSFPDRLSASEFLNLKLSSKQESYVVEYIFSKEAYNSVGGFPELPLAWASDDLFWAKIARFQEIKTIRGVCVKWRYSSLNISGEKNRYGAVQKMRASLLLVEWIKKHRDVERELEPGDLHIYWYARQIRTLQQELTFFDEIKAVLKMCAKDIRILKHYWHVKKEKSKLIGWLKYKLNRTDGL